jgi:hypothetical protein
MRFLFVLIVLLNAVSVEAQERIIQTDSLGNKQYHKQQYVVVRENNKEKVCPVNSLGRIEYHKGCTEILRK